MVGTGASCWKNLWRERERERKKEVGQLERRRGERVCYRDEAEDTVEDRWETVNEWRQPGAVAMRCVERGQPCAWMKKNSGPGG